MMAGKRWDDHYTHRARAERYRARSVYKLQEIDRRFNLIRPGSRVLDLGCYPGSWSQYAIQKVGPQGKVLGIDRQRPRGLDSPNFEFLQADVLDLDPAWATAHAGGFEVLLSDLAPQTTGIHATDVSRSLALAEAALGLACGVLEQGGSMVCKVFEGAGLQEFRREMNRCFKESALLRPAAVRKRSRETYLIGRSYTSSGV